MTVIIDPVSRPPPNLLHATDQAIGGAPVCLNDLQKLVLEIPSHTALFQGQLFGLVYFDLVLKFVHSLSSSLQIPVAICINFAIPLCNTQKLGFTSAQFVLHKRSFLQDIPSFGEFFFFP